jgi:3-oxoacyl-[acyl-carrier-protein] synthase-3
MLGFKNELGIKERRHIAKDSDDSTSSMGVKASKIAIERAGLLPQDIDLILFATLSPDYYFPGSGVLVQEALEIPDCPAMDIRMQCSGFVYAVATADQFIKTGMYKNVLVIGSEYPFWRTGHDHAREKYFRNFW